MTAYGVERPTLHVNPKITQQRGLIGDVVPQVFTEKSCLKLVYAVLIRAAARWQAISITSTEYLQLRMLYEERELALPSNWEAVA